MFRQISDQKTQAIQLTSHNNIRPFSWNDFKSSIYVISLARADQRRSRVIERMKSRGVSYQLVEAVDGEITQELAASFRCAPDSPFHRYEHRQRPITGGELACTISHLNAIYNAYCAGVETALICEDDLDFGDTDAADLQFLVEMLPLDASCLQLCVNPGSTIKALVEYHISTGEIIIPKHPENAVLFDHPRLRGYTCHSTQAYFITRAGMKAICERLFDRRKAVFPCSQQELLSNVALVADRLIYQTAMYDGLRSYVSCLPTLIMDGLDSLLHSDHLSGHQRAREEALRHTSLIKEYRFRKCIS
jgi:GR25 family glycosyltransferase involved in LPS biosynthesis